MTAIVPGSFDPFTIGHADIVKRSLPLFDKVIIAIGKNADKQSCFPIDERINIIKNCFADEKKVEVITYDGLTADIARKHGASYIIRGVRSVADYEYERAMADANRSLTGIETILLYCSPTLAHVSSSFVRDLFRHGTDISSYIP